MVTDVIAITEIMSIEAVATAGGGFSVTLDEAGTLGADLLAALNASLTDCVSAN
ncbi:MAG: hypothetical protein HRU17_24330 [Polyangiaceae bacterium]|nr:hypothetical protein [Polyangiaceae bacterium]